MNLHFPILRSPENIHIKRHTGTSNQANSYLGSITETGSSSQKPRGMTMAMGGGVARFRVLVQGRHEGPDFWLRRPRKRVSTRDPNIRIHCHRHVTSNQPALCQRLHWPLQNLSAVLTYEHVAPRINRSFESSSTSLLLFQCFSPSLCA